MEVGDGDTDFDKGEEQDDDESVEEEMIRLGVGLI